MILELITLVVFSWAIRSLFVAPKHTGFLSDTAAHLFMTKTQAGHRWFNYNFDKTVIPTELGYPKLQHFIISRFAQNIWLTVGARLIILYDVAVVVGLYGLVRMAYPAAEDVFVMGSPAFWAGLLCSSTPILFSVEARLTGLGNARTFSLLQVFVMLVAWHLIGTDNLILFTLVTALMMLVITWSSSFGLQAAIFFALFVSLLTLDPVPAGAVAVSLLVLFWAPVGAREILVHKYQHWVWYFRNLNKGTMGAFRNRREDFAALPKALLTNRTQLARLCFNRLTPMIFLCGMPAVPFILYFQITGHLPGTQPLIQFSQVGVWAGILSFLLISVPRLSFLGEAERYLEYAAPFQAVLLVHLVAQGVMAPVILPLMMLVHLSLLVALFRFRNQSDYAQKPILSLLTPDVRQVLQHFRSQMPADLRVLTLPTKAAFFWSFVCFDMPRLSFYQNFMGSAHGFRAMEEEMSHDNWQYPVDDLGLLQDRYGINRVLLIKGAPAKDAARRETYGLRDGMITFENDAYVIFQL